MKKTIVLGASPKSWRYSHSAVERLVEAGHEVVAIGKSEGLIGDVKIHAGAQPVKDIHTVTIYLRPQLQQQYYDYILSLNPVRIIFNPGAENAELMGKALLANIEPLNACTLVLLTTGQY